MLTKTLLVLLTLFRYVLLFDINNCSDSKLKFEPSGKLEMGCTSSTYFGYCTIKDLKNSKTCTYSFWYKSLKPFQEDNCKQFPYKVKFEGKPEEFVCKFELDNIEPDDVASWEITMEDWKKNIARTSNKFSLVPRNETGCIDKGFVIVGKDDEDILQSNQPNWKTCQLKCQSDHNCSFWSYKTAGQSQGTCKLTTGSVTIESCNDTISGSKECENCFRLDDNLTKTQTEKFGLSSCLKFIGGNAEENQSSLGLILGLVSFFLVLICTTSVGVWYYLKKRQTEEINYDENSVCLRTLNKSRKSLPFTTFFSRTNHEYEDVNCECSNCKGKRGTQDLGYNYQAYPSGCNQESSSGCNQESPPPFYINEPDINASAPPVPNRAKKPPVPS